MKPGDRLRLKHNHDNLSARKGATGTVGQRGIYKSVLGKDLVYVIWDINDLSNRQCNGGYFTYHFEVIESAPASLPVKVDYLSITREIVGR